MRELKESLEPSCPFCRHPVPKTKEEDDQCATKRVEKNDPVALREIMGTTCDDQGDYKRAFEYWTKAAALGDASAHNNLACLYHNGQGVDRDKRKEIYHLEEAAIGGHPRARYNLAAYEGTNNNIERAMKHTIIAARLGQKDAMNTLMGNFRNGLVKKDDLDAALRAHQAAVDATKSAQRDEANKVIGQKGGY